MNSTTKIIIILVGISIMLRLIDITIALSQPKKIAYQASEEDKCVMFLQTSNETFYKLNSYKHGTCEYTKGGII